MKTVKVIQLNESVINILMVNVPYSSLNIAEEVSQSRSRKRKRVSGKMTIIIFLKDYYAKQSNPTLPYRSPSRRYYIKLYLSLM